MPSFRAAADLVVLLKTVNMANVAGLSTRPIIRLKGLSDSGGVLASGELVIDRESFRKERVNQALRDEFYTCVGSYWYRGTDETILKLMLEEFDNVVETQNKGGAFEYFIDMDYDWDTNVKAPKMPITWVMEKPLVST